MLNDNLIINVDFNKIKTPSTDLRQLKYDWLSMFHLLCPDLSPIENTWNIMKHRIEKRKATNVKELKIFIDEEWKKLL